ncbi:unnamed protein product [Prunus armeniaca]|uniref:Auxin-responsive protein n=1 Tax=Prunus armeniaca TaxID=36596 RepID=A0A6J5WIA0_PRUAR|nr:unnamed protein product [Prunus armeniaca]
MAKIRGFKLGKRLCRVTRWFLFRNTRTRTGYSMLNPDSPLTCSNKPMSKLLTWGRKLSAGAKSLCCRKPGSGYKQLGQNPVESSKPVTVPKGHLAVYVGQKDGDFHRVLVPVIYFKPSPLQPASERGRKRVRVSARGRDHHTLPDLGLRERQDPDRRRVDSAQADVEAQRLPLRRDNEG